VVTNLVGSYRNGSCITILECVVVLFGLPVVVLFSFIGLFSHNRVFCLFHTTLLFLACACICMARLSLF
jgi:hypothetical protein